MYAPKILDVDGVDPAKVLIEERCPFCETGKYQDEYQKNETCKECGVGQYADSGGSVKCDRCPVGTYMEDTGADVCRK